MSHSLTTNMLRESLGVFLAEVERQEGFAPDEARELLATCEIPILFLDRLWQMVQECLDNGMERCRLTCFLKDVIGNLELGVNAFELALLRIQAADLTTSECAAGVQLLFGKQR